MKTSLAIFSISYLLCSCAAQDIHRAACNQLKSQIVLNGSTSNTRQAEIENSEKFLSQRTYDASYCDCY